MGVIAHHPCHIYNLTTEVTSYHLFSTLFHSLYSKSSTLTKGRGLDRAWRGGALESVTGPIRSYLLTLFSEPKVSISYHHKNKSSLKDQSPESNSFTPTSLPESIRIKVVSSNSSETPIMERVYTLMTFITFYFELFIFIFSVLTFWLDLWSQGYFLPFIYSYILKVFIKVVTCTNT